MTWFWTLESYLLRTTALSYDLRALYARWCCGLYAFGSIYHEGNPTAILVLQMRKLRLPLPGGPAACCLLLAAWQARSCCIMFSPCVKVRAD